MEKLFHIIDEAVLHVITQCDFLSWDLLKSYLPYYTYITSQVFDAGNMSARIY